MKSLSRLGGSAIRRSLLPIRSQASHRCFTNGAPSLVGIQRPHATPAAAIRTFHSSTQVKGLMPESENPPPKESEDSEQPTVPTDIPTSEYEKRADEFLEELYSRVEQEQEKHPEVEVEYSAGVLEISIQHKGTYVLNKQPANKQIWLSSPISGPKRFDWVVTGEGLNQKEGSGFGDWIYLRDGSSLSEIVRKEIGVEPSVDEEAPK